MYIVFALALILGSALLMLTFFIRHKVSLLKDALNQQEESATDAEEKTSDYDALIVTFSPLMTFFYNIEHKVSYKLKAFSVVVFLVLAIDYLGLIELTIYHLAMLFGLIFVLMIFVPGFLVKTMVNNRKKNIQDKLPYFIDLIAVCVQSGMTVENALKYISHHFTPLDANLANLMTHVVKKAEVSGLEDALHSLYRAIHLSEVRMFCSCLLQSVRYGASLYEALSELAKDMREMQLLQVEEKIGKLSAKMSVPLVLFIMFPIVILIIAPSLLRILQNGVS